MPNRMYRPMYRPTWDRNNSLQDALNRINRMNKITENINKPSGIQNLQRNLNLEDFEPNRHLTNSESRVGFNSSHNNPEVGMRHDITRPTFKPDVSSGVVNNPNITLRGGNPIPGTYSTLGSRPNTQSNFLRDLWDYGNRNSSYESKSYEPRIYERDLDIDAMRGPGLNNPGGIDGNPNTPW